MMERFPPHKHSASVAGTKSYFFPKIQAFLPLKLGRRRHPWVNKVPVSVAFVRYKACCEDLV